MTEWTPERRAKQADMIRRLKPWEKSTGPTTAEGKARASRNSRKHGLRSQPAKDIAKARTHAKRQTRETLARCAAALRLLGC